jgi:hypothetical protein
MRTPLSDDELEAFAEHANKDANGPLAALVAELQARRRPDAGAPWAILVVAGQQLALVPALLAAARAPVLVLMAEGTRIRHVEQRGAARVLFDTYDPAAPLGLRQLLARHGIALT